MCPGEGYEIFPTGTEDLIFEWPLQLDCEPPLELDECGVCDGDNSCLGCDGEPNSGLVLDECGLCDGPGIDPDTGCCETWGQPMYSPADCDGVCGGPNYIDECGVCCSDEVDWQLDGNGIPCGPQIECSDGSFVCDENNCPVVCSDPTACNTGVDVDCLYPDCFGVCDGGAVIDSCGVCGGDNSLCEDEDISGCTDLVACNTTFGATIDDGACLYPDCLGECGGDATCYSQDEYDQNYADGQTYGESLYYGWFDLPSQSCFGQVGDCTEITDYCGFLDATFGACDQTCWDLSCGTWCPLNGFITSADCTWNDLSLVEQQAEEARILSGYMLIEDCAYETQQECENICADIYDGWFSPEACAAEYLGWINCGDGGTCCDSFCDQCADENVPNCLGGNCYEGWFNWAAQTCSDGNPCGSIQAYCDFLDEDYGDCNQTCWDLNCGTWATISEDWMLVGDCFADDEVDCPNTEFPAIYSSGGGEVNFIGFTLPPGVVYNVNDIMNNSFYTSNPDDGAATSQSYTDFQDTIYSRYCLDSDCTDDTAVVGFVRYLGIGLGWQGDFVNFEPGMGYYLMTSTPGWIKWTLP